MRVLVTGSGGMLGRDVARAAEDVGHEVIALAREDLDVRDGETVERAFIERYPGAIVNCAAWTDVDGAEQELGSAMEVNAIGAANVAKAAAALKVPIIYPSTDYVFDGTKGEPYVESDEPRPLSAYGQTKLAGERETAEANPRHFIVRSSWLFGTGGRNFVETMLSLASEVGEVLVVMDQIGCPTYTGHLAAGIMRLLDGDDYGIHHQAGDGKCSWYEFAIEIFRQASADCRVMAATTDMVLRKAPRPPYSVLGSEHEHPIYLPDWREGLAEFLAERAEAHTS